MAENNERRLPVSSSTPPQFAPEQRELFVEVLRLLSLHRVPYAVSGAFALHEHTGIWRDTKDLDLFLAKEDMEGAMEVLDAAGLAPEVCDPVWLCKARHGEFYVDLITGMSNGVITVQRDWIERARDSEVLGERVRVLAGEELIASKLFVTRRERFDGADVVHVIFGTEGQLDWTRILDLAGEHWMVLLWVLLLYQYVYPAQGHYVPRVLWRELLGRLDHELDNPNPAAESRGSLIDEKMFAIDVEEWGLEDLNEQMRKRKAG